MINLCNDKNKIKRFSLNGFDNVLLGQKTTKHYIRWSSSIKQKSNAKVYKAISSFRKEIFLTTDEYEMSRK